MDAGRVIARHSPSLAWLITMYSETAAALQQSGVELAASEGRQAVLVARNHLPGEGIVRRAEGGFEVSGVWTVAGAMYADLVLLSGFRGDPAGTPLPSCVLVEPREHNTVEAAHDGGLQGAGFSNLVLEKHFVPDDRVLPAKTFRPAHSPWGRLGPILGCAEGAYGDYSRITRTRIAGVGGASVARFPHVQARIAEAHAILKANALLYDQIRAALDGWKAEADVVELTRDAAFVARRCLDVVTLLIRQMGALGLSESNPVQHRYRDILAMATDPCVAWDKAMVPFGKREFGLT